MFRMKLTDQSVSNKSTKLKKILSQKVKNFFSRTHDATCVVLTYPFTIATSSIKTKKKTKNKTMCFTYLLQIYLGTISVLSKEYATMAEFLKA